MKTTEYGLLPDERLICSVVYSSGLARPPAMGVVKVWRSTNQEVPLLSIPVGDHAKGVWRAGPLSPIYVPEGETVYATVDGRDDVSVQLRPDYAREVDDSW